MRKLIKEIIVLQASPTSKVCKCLAIIMSIALDVQAAGFMFWFPFVKQLYYCAIVFNILYILGGGIAFDRRFMIFLTILGLNAFLLPIDPIFEAKARYCLFVLVMIICSPLIKTQRAIVYREYVFKYTMLAMVLLGVGSFLSFFLGINMMPYNRGEFDSLELYLEYESNGGRFSGLFAHSMTMGPISALVAIIFFVVYQKYNKKIFMALFFCSVLAVVMSASRSALFALVTSIFYIIFFVSNASKSKKRIVGLLFVGVLFVAPFAERAFKGLVNKQMSRLEQNDGKLNSRDEKFQARLNEFYDSPLWGVGFASINGKRYDKQNNGQIEPGSSHLAVLSMTGLIGMCSYIIVLLYAFNTTRKSNDSRALMLQGLFIAYFAHMWFEGYVFGAGGILCFMFWLVISQCFDYKYIVRNGDCAFC